MAIPTYQDGDLLLRVYEIRRETRLREARDFVLGKAAFRDYEDFKKKYPNESKGRRHMGMVFTYWDMTCALVDRGLLNEELFNACNTEHLFVWFKFRTAIMGMRQDYEYPALLSSLEKVSMRHPFAAKMEQWLAGQDRSRAARTSPPRRAKRRAKRKTARA